MSEFISVLMAGLVGLTPHLAMENTNIAGYDEEHDVSDFNRVRGEITLDHAKYPDVVANLTIDNEMYYTSTPNSLQNITSIYRGYIQYRGVEHFWSIGKQRIPLGVGRVWNPIDVFNPIDSEAIETDERKGTESIRYEYALSELSNIDATLALDKGAVRVKGYLEYADVALIGLWDEDNELDIIGWELEGQLMETGIELRSEGGTFHDRSTGDRYLDYIVGAEYGFANSLTLLAEYRYAGEFSIDYLGAQAGFQPGMLWTCNLLLVENLDDNSGFISPSVEYSLSDEMTLSAGAFVYYGNDDSEYGLDANRYYFRWFVHF